MTSQAASKLVLAVLVVLAVFLCGVRTGLAQNGLIVSGHLYHGSSDEKGYYLIGGTSADMGGVFVMFNPQTSPTMVRQMEALVDGPIELVIRRPQ